MDYEYREEGRTINGAYYAKELRRLRQEIEKKRREKLTWGFLLLQDNAPAQVSQAAVAATTKCSFEVLPFPSMFSRFSSSICFQIWKINLRGRNFGSNEGVIDAFDNYLEDQKECFYFEGISKLE